MSRKCEQGRGDRFTYQEHDVIIGKPIDLDDLQGDDDHWKRNGVWCGEQASKNRHRVHRGIPAEQGNSIPRGLRISGMGRIALSSGGFTRQPVSGDEPMGGYGVSPYGDHDEILVEEETNDVALSPFCNRQRDLLPQDDHYLGGWGDHDAVSLGVKTRARSVAAGIDIAKQHK